MGNVIIYERLRSDERRPTGNVLRYNELYITTYGWLIPSHGTIFSILQTIIAVGGCTIAVTVIAYCSCPIPLTTTSGDSVDNTTTSYCVSLSHPSTTSLTLGTLCTFIIALFSTLILNRWWAIRTNLQNVMTSGHDICSKIMSVLSVKLRHTERDQQEQMLDECQSFVSTVVGLLILSLHMVFARSRHDSPISAMILVEQGILKKEQLDYVLSFNDEDSNAMICTCQYHIQRAPCRMHSALSGTVAATKCDPLLPISIILTLIHEHTQVGGLLARSIVQAPNAVSFPPPPPPPPPTPLALLHPRLLPDVDEVVPNNQSSSLGCNTPPFFRGATLLIGDTLRTGDTGVSGLREADILVKSMTDLRQNIRNVMIFIDVQLPLPFIQIVSAVVWTFMVQLVLMCSSYVAFGRQNHDGPSVTTGYITIVLYSFALLGLLRLFHVLSNPMDSTHRSNFPHETYMREYIQSLHTIRVEGFAFVNHGDVFRHQKSSTKYPLSMKNDTVIKLLDHHNNKPGTIAEEQLELTSRSSNISTDGFSSNYVRGQTSTYVDDRRSSFCSVTPLMDSEKYHLPDYDIDDERNGSFPDGRRGEEDDEEGGFGGGPREYPRDVRQRQFVLPRVQVPIGPPLRSLFTNRFDVSPSRLDVIPPPSTTCQ